MKLGWYYGLICSVHLFVCDISDPQFHWQKNSRWWHIILIWPQLLSFLELACHTQYLRCCLLMKMFGKDASFIWFPIKINFFLFSGGVIHHTTALKWYFMVKSRTYLTQIRGLMRAVWLVEQHILCFLVCSALDCSFSRKSRWKAIHAPLPSLFPSLTPEVKAGFLLFWPSALMCVAQYPHP